MAISVWMLGTGGNPENMVLLAAAMIGKRTGPTRRSLHGRVLMRRELRFAIATPTRIIEVFGQLIEIVTSDGFISRHQAGYLRNPLADRQGRDG